MNAEKAYNELVNKFPFSGYLESEVYLYKTVAKIAINNLRPGASILDFGSGPCDKTALLKLMGFDCTACDDLKDNWHSEGNNRKKIINFANSLDIQFYETNDFDDLPFKKETFDMVMLTDVIEHLHESPRSLLLNLIDSLKNGGILFITVPNAGNIRKRIDLLIGKTNMPPFSEYYLYPGTWRGHIREYVYDDLKKLAQYLDLKVIDIRGENHMLQKVPKILLPIYLSVTAIFTGWRDSWSLVAQKKIV